MNRLSIITLCCILSARTFAASTTQPVDRADAIHQALRDVMEQAYSNGGDWPDQFPSPGGQTHLIYSKPPKFSDDERQLSIASATVVVHESLEENSAGVWIGYADGHLEFAADAKTLADCQNQLSIARDAMKNARQPSRLRRNQPAN